MPRTSRNIRPGRFYHLISRFVDREWFIRDEKERERYLDLLGRAVSRSDWRCLSHAIMNNHIHLGTIAGTEPLDSWVRRVHSPFADWMNRRHERIGSLFVRGPKDIETPAERIGALIAYIHNNPVRAGVVDAPGASRWTSHRAYLGLDVAPRWLHVEQGLELAGFKDRRAFNDWVCTRPAEREIVETIEKADEEAAPATTNDVPDPKRIVKLAADMVGIPLAQLCSRRRSDPEAMARRIAVFCAASSGVSDTQIAGALGVSQQAVSLIRQRGADSAVARIGTHVLQQLRAV
jgi:hypothetical protein